MDCSIKPAHPTPPSRKPSEGPAKHGGECQQRFGAILGTAATKMPSWDYGPLGKGNSGPSIPKPCCPLYCRARS